METAQYFVENKIDRLDLRDTIGDASCSSTMIELLYKAGAHLDDEDAHGCTPLVAAARSNCQPKGKKLIELGADPNKMSWGLTPLGHAAKNGHGDFVRILLAAGAQTDSKDYQMLSPRESAEDRGYDEIANGISHNADTDSAREEIDTISVETGEHEIDEADALVDAVCDLTTAAVRGDLGVVQRLIQEGCGLKAETSSLWSPLSLAINWNRWEVAKVLVEAGAELNFCRKNDDGTIDMPFMDAVTQVTLDQVALIELMIRHRANVNFRDEDDSTPLLESLKLFESQSECSGKACYINGKIVRVLLKAGADANAIDKHGRTPLGKAAALGNCKAIIALVEAGAHLNKTSSQNTARRAYPGMRLIHRTPLAWAALMGRKDVVKLLFDAGADWKSLPQEPALTYTHHLLIQSWFSENAEAPVNAVPGIDLLSVPSKETEKRSSAADTY